MPAVLLIDDNAELTENLQEVLADEEIMADVARSGPVALDMLARTRYDLVVTDMRMPGMTGLDVLREIHHRWPALPVLVMTAYARDTLLREAQEHGALGILPKPLDLDYLIEVVRRLIEPDAPVLVVEDDADLRVNLAEALLEVAGTVPHPAPTLAYARKLAERVAFRAAIIDMRLPDGDGGAFGDELRARMGDPDLTIIYVTGYGAQLGESVAHLLRTPRVHLLEKPFAPDRLLELVLREL
jgi:DNA-binding NtrC family response regulator